MNQIYIENIKSYWGLIVFILIPVLIYLIGFVVKRRKKKGKGILPPQLMRYFILPLTFFFLLLNKIFEIPSTHFVLKVTETILTIFIISFLFNAINYLFFSENNLLTGKEKVPKLGRDVLHFILVTIISACVLSAVWGLNLGDLLTALGVSSLVLGLALQEPLGNLFNGIAILMAKPFSKGDWISIGKETGEVVEHNWRSVKINNGYDELIIIPNNMLGKEKIKNLSEPNKIHAELVTVNFSYNDHPDKVKQVLLETVGRSEGILKAPIPETMILNYEDSSIKYGMKFYFKDFKNRLLIMDTLLTNIYFATEKNNLSMPYPRQDLYIFPKSES